MARPLQRTNKLKRRWVKPYRAHCNLYNLAYAFGFNFQLCFLPDQAVADMTSKVEVYKIDRPPNFLDALG